MSTTLVISDLHLGSRRPVDVLRRPAPLAALCERLAEVDRLVLLGDVLELRHGPLRDALAAARPVMEAIGAALPRGAEVVITPGNHDHALVAPWLRDRGLQGDSIPPTPPAPLGLETRVAAAQASPGAAALGAWLTGGRRRRAVELAYPGVWLREDVWATHGHYLDRLITVPTFERLAAGGMARVVGKLPDSGATAEDFEAGLAPMYAWLDTLANSPAAGGRWATGAPTAKTWALLSGDGRAPLRGRALAALLPLGIAGLNLAGIGPIRAELSSDELRRANATAILGVIRALGVDARHVVFGHSHCAGPLPGMDAAEWREGPTAVHNCGCWTDEPMIESRAHHSPYRPGRAIVLQGDGPPRLETVAEDLGDRPGHAY